MVIWVLRQYVLLALSVLTYANRGWPFGQLTLR